MSATAAALPVCLALLGLPAACRAQSDPTTPPVSYRHIVRHNPNYSIHIVNVNLLDPRVSAHVSRGGPDPDGDGPWLTTLLPTREIAGREHYDIAVNGDFFLAKFTFDIEGRNTGYVRGKFAAPEGPAMTDGKFWHHPTNDYPYLEITSSKTARLMDGRVSDPIDPGARQIVGGRPIIVRGGKAIVYTTRFATNRHPRTAVGLNKAGTELTLLVVDGRQPALSIGMTLAELSDEMIRAGCDSALNLDGGGSTTLVYREPDSHKLTILNSPSDSRERSVADILGITVNAPLPLAK
jgi:exopolysaccharide biosynthesis protein